ncbi:MAG: AEC family transporter [Sulfuritalea sp.]|nr:AEC family transporter [Sulfuritalea sp.]
MIAEFLDTLEFSFSVTGPIFVILGLGAWLRRIGMINDAFVEVGTRLVFNVTLPALLFISVSKTHLDTTANFALIGFGITATLLVWGAGELTARLAVREERDRGVVVQGIFRSNMAIIGLAYCVNAYGDAGLAAASLYVGLVTILFNVLSIVTLSKSLHASQSVGRVLRSVAMNPLIIGILLALPVSMSGIHLPAILFQSGEYFARMTLPLALLCTGAALNFRSLRNDPRDAMLAATGKLLVVPLLFVIAGAALGFRGMDLGILLLMSSAPSAAAGYVMVRAMGGNSALAANIIALTTVGSLFTTSAGIVILKSMSLM